MPAHVLIVEGDAALSSRLRSALAQRGHSIEETPDGREVIHLARQRRPGVIVLSVELPGGQNGYLLVGKLKKDDELRGVPVVIVGNPEGFSAHAKLKNRADEYLAKPVDIQGLVAVVGRLTGTADEPPPPSEEEATVSGDPDLDLIDAAFDEAPAAPRPAPTARAATRASPPPPPPEATAAVAEDDFSSLGDEGPTLVQMEASAPLPAAPRPAPEPEPFRLELTPAPLREVVTDSAPPQMELTPAALREMETPGPAGPVPGLQSALDDAQARAFAAEVRASQLEAQLQESGAPGRQETARRDRETLRLKSELEAAQQAIADLRDQQTQGEQKTLELSGELSRRDSQLKSLQAKLDQALQEKRRLEQALQSAKAGAGAVEQLDQVQQELVAARRDLELNRAHAEGAERQLSGLRERAESAEVELAELRDRADQAAAQAGELEALQGRVIELEVEVRKHEDRVTRLYARLKAEERAREKARKAVAVTAQLLAEPRPAAPDPETGGEPPGEDEPAVAG
jgi:CheY-like chemotaxis protein